MIDDIDDLLDEELSEGEVVLEIESANGSDPLLEGGIEIILVGEGEEDNLFEEPIEFHANLAEHMEEDDLSELSSDLISLVEADINGRQDWVDTYIQGLKILGLKYEERSEPWEGACGVNSTLLSEAVIRFQAETMSETFPASGPVKTKIIGKETKQKVDAAERVKTDMNYQLTEVMYEYRPEHERMLWALGLSGSAFKKVYNDPQKMRQTAVYVPAEEVIVPYGASNIEDAERVTHVMRKTKNELAMLQDSGFYRDVDLGEPEIFHSDIEEKKAEDAGFTVNDDDRYAFYEIHVEMVIEEFDDRDGLAAPYVVTIDKGTNEVLGIRRNWDEEDPLYNKRQHFVHYCYIPSFGFYGLGLIHIVGGYAQAGTSIIRQLVDAGTLSNLPGGLKTRDLRNKGEDSPIAPGEWRDVDVGSGSLRDNIMPLPYKEPSATLAGLLDTITQEGRRLGAISDMNVSDMSANAPVGTTLALLERTLKPMAAVQSRVHYAMKGEFKLIKALIAENAPQHYDYDPATGEISAVQEDYLMVEVIPVSDPNSSTMAQRVVQYQTVLQMSEKAPEIYDLPQLHRQMIEVIGVKNADKLIPLSEDAEPQDPVTENMGVLIGDPIKAFIHQDHKAHIATHQAFIQDPNIAATIGQNPQAQKIMAALQAHIAEHLGFSYRSDIAAKLGVDLPPYGEKLPLEIENLLSQVVADAATQVTAQNKKEAAQKQQQQQAQQAAQDPNLKIAQEAERTKRMEVERKTAKDQAEMQLSMGDQQLRAMKEQATLQLGKSEQQRKQGKDVVDSELRLEEIAEQRRNSEMEAQRSNEQLSNERKELDRRVDIDALRVLMDRNKNGNK
jgi:hypothetical protein|tara:strand:+ start:556 stop:3075 length:2520 start_codon:yes stop_codon:yes gene_type:complete